MCWTTCISNIKRRAYSRASKDSSVRDWAHWPPALCGGRGTRPSDCKYLSPVTQRNNASRRMWKNLEENFMRDFIVWEILALWEKRCLLCPQHTLTGLLLCEAKVSPAERGPNLQRIEKNFWNNNLRQEPDWMVWMRATIFFLVM